MFKVGDRVKVMRPPFRKGYIGKAGTIVKISAKTDYYVIRYDDDWLLTARSSELFFVESGLERASKCLK